MIRTKKQAISAIKTILHRTTWSQRKLAKEAGINHATISRLLSGAEGREPAFETRDRLNKVLATL